MQAVPFFCCRNPSVSHHVPGPKSADMASERNAVRYDPHPPSPSGLLPSELGARASLSSLASSLKLFEVPS